MNWAKYIWYLIQETECIQRTVQSFDHSKLNLLFQIPTSLFLSLINFHIQFISLTVQMNSLTAHLLIGCYTILCICTFFICDMWLLTIVCRFSETFNFWFLILQALAANTTYRCIVEVKCIRSSLLYISLLYIMLRNTCHILSFSHELHRHITYMYYNNANLKAYVFKHL